MKTLQYFLLILLSSSSISHACGYYPYGEDIRYCFFRPEYYGYESYSTFFYSSNSFDPVNEDNGSDSNVQLWYKYCKGKVPQGAIYMAVYEMTTGDFKQSSKNEMIRYLYSVKDREAIEYLKFAKKCEIFNEQFPDPWEREETVILPQRAHYINQATAFARKLQNNSSLKLRYNFLAMRMAFYNSDKAAIKAIYDEVAANTKDKDILYYWSLYFRTVAESDKPLASFYAAQVFANAPDKRFPVHWSYENSIPVAEILKFAKTNNERANVYLLAATKRTDRCLSDIKQMYAANKSHEGLEFLLLREINKIEDWVHTPYYSLFIPSVTNGAEETDWSAASVLQRVNSDRRYAAEVLQFVSDADMKRVHDPHFWQLAKAQLQFATKKYEESLATIAVVENNMDKKSAAYRQIKILKALALTASQNFGSAIILEEVKPILLDNSDDQKFVFAIGRELEYRGNTNDAALLYSMLSDGYDESSYYTNSAYWKTLKGVNDTYGDYYSDYFGYLNEVYTPEQLEQLLLHIETNNAEDRFSQWKFSVLKNKVSLLYDLLGTKYIRQNKLQSALKSFAKAGSDYWADSSSMWEKNDYVNMFDNSPFYVLKRSPSFAPEKDTIQLNKYSITKQLIKYLNKASNTEEKDRDYYYFLIANCYYNMTQYGNCWMMRRFSYSSSYADSPVEDEKEFRECSMAKKYYALAMSKAKKPKFKALCLRMMATCDNNREEYKRRDLYGEPNTYISPYFIKLKAQYPSYYSDLTSNCTKFNEYFNARR